MVKKIILNIIKVVLALLLVTYMIITVILASNSSKGLSKVGNSYLLHVESDSMSPKIKTGDLILVKTNTHNIQYKKGDIVAFFSNNDLIIHEIEVVAKDVNGDVLYYRTKGLNNSNLDDEFLEQGDIIGMYKGFRLPLIGYIAIGANTQLGYTMIVILPMAISFSIITYMLVLEIMKIKSKERMS